MSAPRAAVLLPALVAAAVIAAGWLEVGPQPPPARSPSPPARPEPPARVDLYGDPLPPGVVARLGTSRFRRSDRYGAVAFSPDGKTLAALGDEAQISLWDVASGKEIYREPWPQCEGGDPRSLQVHTVLAFSPDGATLLVGWDWIGRSRPLCLWDVARRKERLRMEGAHDGFRSAAVSADFRTLAVAATDGRVGLWDVASGKPRAGWSAPEVKAQLVALSADGRTLATAGEDRTARLWDAASGKEIRAFPARERPIAALAFAPDGRTLACEDQGECVLLYGLAPGGGDRQWNLDHWGWHMSSDYDNLAPFYLLAFSPDGRTLVLWDRDCTPNLWDVASGERRRALSADPIGACGFSADGKTLAVAGNGFLALYDAASGDALYPTHDYGVSQVCFSPDGREVITLAGNKVRCWDGASGKLRRLIWTTPRAVLSANGRTVIGRNESGFDDLTVHDTASGDRPHCCVGRDAWGEPVALSSDERTVAVGSWSAPEDLKLVSLAERGASRD